MFFSPPLGTPGLRKAAKKVAEEQPVRSGQFGTFGSTEDSVVSWDVGKGLEGEGFRIPLLGAMNQNESK